MVDSEINFNIALVGDGGVGKTTFLNRYHSEARSYINIRVEFFKFRFSTSNGNIAFIMKDTSGQERLSGLRDAFYIGAQSAIIMFDVTSRISYKNISNWHRDINRVCDNIPIVLVGNKVDSKDRRVKAKQITYHRKHNLPYFEISCKANYQLDKPFLWIARQLLADPHLTFIESCLLKPPEIEIDDEQLKLILKEHQEMEAMNKKLLPDDNDELKKLGVNI